LTAEQLKKQANKQRQRDAKAKKAPAPAKEGQAEAEASIDAFAMDVDAEAEPKKEAQMYTDASTTCPSTCADSEVGDSEVASSSGAHRRGINKAKPLEGIPENNLGAVKRYPSWPYVPCASEGCEEMEKWKNCNQVRVVTKTSNEVYGDDNEEFHIDYYCPKCMARQWNCSLAEAQSRIRDTAPLTKAPVAAAGVRGGGQKGSGVSAWGKQG
jgi:hypothetical protein